MINVLMSRSGALNSKWGYDALKDILKEDMKVVIIGFSFFGELDKETYFDYYGEDSEYQEKMREIFKPYNITNINWIYYYDQSKEEMLDLINSADILYFPGGAPDLMYNRINEKGILEALEKFDKIVIGSSAGAMIQLKNYHISKDNEYNKFSEQKGLGYIDSFFIEVHYRRRRKQKSSMRKMRRKYKKPVYTIPDDGMVIKNNDKIITVNEAKLFYTKKGINKGR